MALHQKTSHKKKVRHVQAPQAKFGLRQGIKVVGTAASIIFPPAAPFIAAGVALTDPLLKKQEEKKADEETQNKTEIAAFDQQQQERFTSDPNLGNASSDIPIFREGADLSNKAKHAQDGGDFSDILGFDPSDDELEKATAIANGAIEVEENELLLQRTDSGRFKEIKDFKDAPPHTEGGELFVPSDDDIIFPANTRSKVREFLKKKDFQSIDSLRLELPKSGSVKARFGMINSSNSFSTDAFKAQSGLDNTNLLFDPDEADPFREVGVNLSDSFFEQNKEVQNPALIATQPNNLVNTGFPQEFSTSPVTAEVPVTTAPVPTTSNVGNIAGNIAALAPAISNIVTGLDGRAKVTKPVFNPQGDEAISTLKDISFDIDPGLRDVDLTEEAAFDKARNLSAGNASVLLGNIGNIRSQTLRQKNKLRTQKSNVENLARRQVAGAQLKVGEQRAQAELFAQQSTEAAEAQKRDFTRTGISQLSEAIQRQQLQQNRELADKEKLAIVKAAFPDLANVL